MNSKDKGNITEAIIMYTLISLGLTVLQVFGDNARYDLAVDINGSIKKIQCKTARNKDNGIIFSTCSSQVHRGKDKQDYKGQIDYFGVFCPETNDICVVPIDICPSREMKLKRTKSKHGNQFKERFIIDYHPSKLCVETLHDAPKEN